MLQAYLAENTNFEANGDIILSPSTSVFNVKINGICEIEMSHPYDEKGRWKYLSADNIISGPTPYSEKQLFRIYDINKGMFNITLKARHIFFDLIDSIILDNRAENKTCQEALNILLNGTKYTGTSNINKVSTCYFVDMNRIEALNGDKDNTIINRWGGELFLNNFSIAINDRIGDDYGVSITYGSNMLDVNLKTNLDHLGTRIYPKAFDGKKLPEKFVDSPLINKYSHVKERFLDCTDLKLKDENSDEGFNTEAELFTAMRKRVTDTFADGLDKPLIQGNVNLAILENTLSENLTFMKNLYNVGLGDDITIKHIDIGIECKSRCVGYSWDMIAKKYLNIEIGDIIDNYFDTKDKLEKVLKDVVNKDGSLAAEKVTGMINCEKARLRAMKDVAETQHVRAMLFEDLDPASPTYGAMCLGTMGFQIAGERTPDGKAWDWRTFGTGKGFFADLIVAGELNASLIKAGIIRGFNDSLIINLDTGEVDFQRGKILGSNMKMDLNEGEFECSYGVDKIRIKDGELWIGDNIRLSQHITGSYYLKDATNNKNIITYWKNDLCNLGDIAIELTAVDGKDVVIRAENRISLQAPNISANGTPLVQRIANLENAMLQQEGLL